MNEFVCVLLLFVLLISWCMRVRVCVYTSVCISVCDCVRTRACVCMYERERERKKKPLVEQTTLNIATVTLFWATDSSNIQAYMKNQFVHQNKISLYPQERAPALPTSLFDGIASCIDVDLLFLPPGNIFGPHSLRRQSRYCTWDTTQSSSSLQKDKGMAVVA